MAFDYRYVLKAGTVGVLATLLISQVRELIKAINDMREVKSSEIKTIEDV
jgi:N-acetylglucosamine-6-phosphate deacetylase